MFWVPNPYGMLPPEDDENRITLADDERTLLKRELDAERKLTRLRNIKKCYVQSLDKKKITHEIKQMAQNGQMSIPKKKPKREIEGPILLEKLEMEDMVEILDNSAAVLENKIAKLKLQRLGKNPAF